MRCKGVSSDVEKGDNLSVAMSKKTIFPPMMLRMVAAGESTGKIDEMLEKMADFWDEEIESTLNALTSLLEPILIVVLGVIVGGIVIALFLPIFQTQRGRLGRLGRKAKVKMQNAKVRRTTNPTRLLISAFCILHCCGFCISSHGPPRRR